MKLKVGDIIEVHGWVMLAKLDEGKYRVKNVGVYHGIEFYDFSKPRGKKTIVRHATADVDLSVKGLDNPDNNKIVVLAG